MSGISMDSIRLRPATIRIIGYFMSIHKISIASNISGPIGFTLSQSTYGTIFDYTRPKSAFEKLGSRFKVLPAEWTGKVEVLYNKRWWAGEIVSFPNIAIPDSLILIKTDEKIHGGELLDGFGLTVGIDRIDTNSPNTLVKPLYSK